MDPIFMSPVRDLRMSNAAFSPYGQVERTPLYATPGTRVLFTSPLSTGFLGSPPFSPGYVAHSDMLSPQSEGMKRGRPRANQISSLMVRGNEGTGVAAIRCPTCQRVFPRDKSLQAHMRTHTGERPYICDYPDCNRAFCQSGQLKTHQRLHSGEKPFKCTADSCQIRFTHANRHCPDHPNTALVRDEDNMPIPALDDKATTSSVQLWLQKYIHQRQDRTPNKFHHSLNQPATKRSLYQDLENQYIESKRRQTTTPRENEIEPFLDVATTEDVQTSPEHDAKPCDLSMKDSHKSQMDNYPVTPKGVEKQLGLAVSVIRRAPINTVYFPAASPSTAVTAANDDQEFRTPQKHHGGLVALTSTPNRAARLPLGLYRDVLSPIKSPRKQAALALIQLAGID